MVLPWSSSDSSATKGLPNHFRDGPCIKTPSGDSKEFKEEGGRPRSLRRKEGSQGVSRRAEDVSKVDLVWSSYDSSAIKCHLNDFRCVS